MLREVPDLLVDPSVHLNKNEKHGQKHELSGQNFEV